MYRLFLSAGYRRAADQVDSQYDLLQQEEITAWSSKVANSQRSRAQKYRDLREHYKKKYYRNQGEAA